MKHLAVYALTLSLLPSPASAATYLFKATGTVGAPYSVDRNFKPIATPSMSIHAGDAFSVSFIVDPAAYSVASLYDADPTINIYDGSVSDYSLKIGAYNDIMPSNAALFSSVQLWNNYIISGSAVDLFSISASSRITYSSSPVDLGAGTISESFGFSGFDFSGTARSSDLITDITPLSSFNSQSAYIGFLNTSTYDQTTFSIVSLSASVVSIGGVPEPATWAMMMLGFGLASLALRQREFYGSRKAAVARAQTRSQPEGDGGRERHA